MPFLADRAVIFIADCVLTQGAKTINLFAEALERSRDPRPD